MSAKKAKFNTTLGQAANVEPSTRSEVPSASEGEESSRISKSSPLGAASTAICIMRSRAGLAPGDYSFNKSAKFVAKVRFSAASRKGHRRWLTVDFPTFP